MFSTFQILVVRPRAIKFDNASLNTFINNNTDVNIRLSMCFKDVKHAKVEAEQIILIIKSIKLGHENVLKALYTYVLCNAILYKAKC